MGGGEGGAGGRGGEGKITRIETVTHMVIPIAHNKGHTQPHFHRLLASVFGSVCASSAYCGSVSLDSGSTVSRRPASSSSGAAYDGG